MKHDLTRTRDAIAAYDMANAEFTTEHILSLPLGQSLRCLQDLDDLAEAVGVAYGEDTKSINNVDTCRQYVRPGPATLAVGETQPSFVRRMVADWEKSLTSAE
jgi:hypothetical protein